MSRPIDAFEPAPLPADSERPGLLSAPPEGWTSFFALVVMMVVVGIAVDDARWVGTIRGTSSSQTAFLPLMMVLAVIVGGLLGRTRLGPLRASAIGALIGGAYLLNSAAGSVSRAPDLGERLTVLNQSLSAYTWDTFGRGLRSDETSAFLLLVGMLLWAAAQQGAFAAFRRQQALPAIVLGASALLVNMSVTTRDQLPHLVLFSTAALVLVVRLNLLRLADGWRSRRLVDAGYAAQIFLRHASVFVALAVVAAIVLATVGSSAPLARAWRGLDNQLLEVGYEVNHWLGGVSGPARGPTNLFGPIKTMQHTWESSSELVFFADTSDDDGYYWRGATYDSFDGRSWQQLDLVTSLVAGGSETLALSAEPPAGLDGRRSVEVTVTSVSLGGDYIVVPDSPLVVNRTLELDTHGEGAFAALRMADGLREGTTYTAQALVPITDGDGAVSADELAATGIADAPWLRRYLEIRPGSIGPRTYAEAERIVNSLPADRRDAYHIAEAIQRFFLTGGGFTYSTDIRGQCTDGDLVDCFLEVRRGFCEWYATAMTMMLRSQGVPARYVVGYLPGQYNEPGWVVNRSAAHAWVEVYFDGYGWLRFDPTPGNFENGQAATVLEDDPASPSATPRGTLRPTPSGRDPRDDDFDREGRGPLVPPPSGNDDAGGDPRSSIAIALLLLTALALLVLSRARRVKPVEAGRAYAGLTRWAARLGHPPKPTQTVFEYTGGLADLVPAVATDLHALATAKVEATYAGPLAAPRFSYLLALSYRRARVGLVRLVMRRPRWLRLPRTVKPR